MDTTFDRFDRHSAVPTAGHDHKAARRPAPTGDAPRATPVAFAESGAGWYHDAAITAAKDSVGHPYRWPY